MGKGEEEWGRRAGLERGQFSRGTRWVAETKGVRASLRVRVCGRPFDRVCKCIYVFKIRRDGEEGGGGERQGRTGGKSING